MTTINKKEELRQKYNVAFNNETVNLSHDLYNKIRSQTSKFYCITFLSTILIMTILIYFSDFLQRNFGTLEPFLVLLQILVLPLIYSFVMMVITDMVSLNSYLIKIINPSLYRISQQNKESIKEFFLNEKNIANMFICINYCKTEFNAGFTRVASRISTENMADEFLKAFNSQDVNKIIYYSIDIRKEVDKILNNKSIKTNDILDTEVFSSLKT